MSSADNSRVTNAAASFLGKLKARGTLNEKNGVELSENIVKEIRPIFNDLDEFLKKSNIQKRKFFCHACQKFLSSKQNLKNHTNIHVGAKPHKCKYMTISLTNDS